MGTKLLVDTCYLHVAKGFITHWVFSGSSEHVQWAEKVLEPLPLLTVEAVE